MAINKIIYGSGRVPLPSEFTLGEVIINVDDARIYSKDKQNNVFEVASNAPNFATASFSSGSTTFNFTSSKEAPSLIFSASTGIRFTEGSNPNSIVMEVTGESSVTQADTASFLNGTVDIISQTNLVDGTGLSFDNNTLNVDDIFLRNDQNDATSFNLTANQLIASDIIKLSAKSDRAAVAGGLLYSSSNEFYLGFS